MKKFALMSCFLWLLTFSTNLFASAQWVSVPHKAYYTTIYQPAGTALTIETTDLKAIESNRTPDTYLYVMEKNSSDSNWTLCATDDDGGVDFASKVTFFTTKSMVKILVTSYSPYRFGTMDLMVNGSKIANDLVFGGARVPVSNWVGRMTYNGVVLREADSFRVAGAPAHETLAPIHDSMLYMIGGVGNPVSEDDDSGSGYQAHAYANGGCIQNCWVVVSAYSEWSTGYALLVKNDESQADNDGDGLKADTESDLGTSDQSFDSDGDRINDAWEVFGLPPKKGENTIGSDDCLELHALGAWPNKRNTFIYIDMMQGAYIDPDQQSWLEDSLANDGAYSGGIEIHPVILTSYSFIPFYKYMARLECTKPKSNPDEWISAMELRESYLDPRYRWFVHYAVKGVPNDTFFYDWNYIGADGNGCLIDYGMQGEADDKDPIITLYWSQRGILVHELGHNYSLEHFKGESIHPIHPKTVMNYRYATSGFLGMDGKTHWGYANGLEGPLCDPNDPTECDFECECNEWIQIKHPIPSCGDGVPDGGTGAQDIPGDEYARCCEDYTNYGGNHLCN